MKAAQTIMVPVIAIAFVACASGGGGGGGGGAQRANNCAPVAAEFSEKARQVVFPECGVDRKASPPRTLPKLQFQPTGKGQDCGRVDLEVVIDSTGRVLMETVRVVRSTDNAFRDAVVERLRMMRYTPAKLDGRAVAQLTTVTDRYSIVTVVSTSPIPGAYPSSAARAAAPKC